MGGQEGSGPMRMRCDIFCCRLLTTGSLSARHPVVVGTGDGAWGRCVGAGGSVGVFRARCCHLRAGFQ
jgi:hypothetical protein